MSTSKARQAIQSNVQLQSWLILVLLSIVWGSSFILIKKAMIVFDPYEVASLRILCSSIAFLPMIIYLRKEIKWHKWKQFLLVGMMGSGIPAFMYPLAQQGISSGIAGVLNSLTPAFTFLVGIIVFKNVFSKGQFIGLSIGLAGAVALAAYGDGSFDLSNLWYAMFAVIASVCYAFNVNMVKAFFTDTRSIIISAMSFGMIGLPALIYLVNTDVVSSITSHPNGWTSFGAILLLSLVGTVAATILFFKLVKMTNPVFAASVCYLMPVISLAWGLWDGEYIGVFHIVTAAVILVGVYLIEKAKG